LGTGGARSTIRGIIGVTTQSQGGEDVWAVADIFLKCAIRSLYGGCMLIPRKDEGLRVFLQLTEEDLQILEESKKQSANKGLQNNEAFKLSILSNLRLKRPFFFKCYNTYYAYVLIGEKSKCLFYLYNSSASSLYSFASTIQTWKKLFLTNLLKKRKRR
jgi:hypothetical protein